MIFPISLHQAKFARFAKFSCREIVLFYRFAKLSVAKFFCFTVISLPMEDKTIYFSACPLRVDRVCRSIYTSLMGIIRASNGSFGMLVFLLQLLLLLLLEDQTDGGPNWCWLDLCATASSTRLIFFLFLWLIRYLSKLWIMGTFQEWVHSRSITFTIF